MNRISEARLITLIYVIALIGQSCTHDAEYIVTPSEGDETEVVFSVKTNSSSTLTRALEPEDEDAIAELQIMAFLPQEKGGGYQYMTYARKKDNTPGSQQYVAKMRTGTYDLMVFANSYKYIYDYIDNAFTGGGIPRNTPKEQIVSGLKMNLPDRWNAKTGSAGYKNMPMWDIKKGAVINKDKPLADSEFELVRALARINVSLDIKPEESGNFELTSVRYYNRRKNGQLIPGEWNTLGNGKYVTLPSLVTGDAGDETGLIYGSEYIVNKASCTNEIYVLEAPAGAMNNHPAYPCLVVGGNYNGREGFYRIDFALKANDNIEYMPILRNHTYDITISHVYGAGFTDPDDAYNSLPVNIEANVVQWNNGGMGTIYFDGQNYLSVVSGEYELSWEEYDSKQPENTVRIKTDYNGGWEKGTIEYIPNDVVGWIRFKDGDKGLKDEESVRWFELDANTTGAERTAIININVGRINGKIKVTQGIEPELQLIILDKDGYPVNDREVFRYGSDMWTNTECAYTVKWHPKNAVAKVVFTNGSNGKENMEFTADSDILHTGDISDVSGERRFGFKIKPFDTSPAKSRGEISLPHESGIEYSFTVTHPVSGESVTRSFIVRNELLDVQVTKVNYCLQGRFYNVTLAYNTDWEVGFDGNSTIIDSETTNRMPKNGQGEVGYPVKYETFKVRLDIGSEHDGKRFSSLFKPPGSTDKVYDRLDLVSLYNHPNSFIVKPNTIHEFSVAKAFRMWESEYINMTLDTTKQFEAVRIWEDGKAGTDEKTGATATFIPAPQGRSIRESRISVHSTGEGNAVIGLLLDGEVIWSWHIWFTEYEGASKTYTIQEGPTSFTLMDRNLGAKNNAVGTNTSSHGVYYQWGRKDPFPTSAKIDNLPNGPLLGAGGNWNIIMDDRFYVEVSNSTGLIPSIRRPDKFFLGNPPYYDWYSNGPDYALTFWKASDDLLKTEFDPCPEGWRVPNLYEFKNDFYYYTFTFKVDDTMRETYGWSNTDIGNLPNAGYLNENGRYSYVGSECWLWYGVHDKERLDGRNDPYKGLGDMISVNDGYHRNRSGRYKSVGMPIRCEQDNARYIPSWD